MDKLFGLDTPVAQKDLAFLHTFQDDIPASMARELLQSEGIPYLAKDRGTGNVMRILAGYSMYGIDFYVRHEDLDRATDLLCALFPNLFDEGVEEILPYDEGDCDGGDCDDGGDADA